MWFIVEQLHWKRISCYCLERERKQKRESETVGNRGKIAFVISDARLTKVSVLVSWRSFGTFSFGPVFFQKTWREECVFLEPLGSICFSSFFPLKSLYTNQDTSGQIQSIKKSLLFMSLGSDKFGGTPICSPDWVWTYLHVVVQGTG